MQPQLRTLLLTTLALVPGHTLPAQPSADPFGHWEGAIQTPQTDLKFAIDLAKSQNGEFVGTISIPAQNLLSLPLRKVAGEGRSIRFHARSDQPITGTVSADGKSISDELSAAGQLLPVTSTRTGEAPIAVPAKLPPVSKELEGSWSGTLEANGAQVQLRLTMSNQPDGSTNATMVDLDQAELSIPVSEIKQTAQT